MTATLPPAEAASAESMARHQARRARLLAPITVVSAVVVGLLAGKLALVNQGPLIFGLAAIPLLIFVWRSPRNGVLTLLAIAVLFEQYPYSAGSRPGAATSRIPLFGSVVKGSGISAVELLLLVTLTVWLMQGAVKHRWNPPRSPLAKSVAALLCLVVVAIGVGAANGSAGSQVVLYEVRPWLYLGSSYLLASSFLRSRTDISLVLWVLVLGSGFKALQGVQILMSLNGEKVEAILSHEESYFFGVFLMLVLALWLFGVRGRLRTVGTLLAPLVLYANMANARRTAWAIIGIAVLLLFGVAYSSLPDRRRMLRVVAVVVLAVSAVYFPMYWNKSGTLAQPARALRAQSSPDARDRDSNLYRDQEDANLHYNIRKQYGLGKGFGPYIDYALPMIDISSFDPYVRWLPHNSVLDLWMRMGTQGMIVFLMMIGTGIIRAAGLARSPDRTLAVLGAVTVCALAAYVVQGNGDLGFFWFRIALCMGTLLGAVEASLRLPRPPAEDASGERALPEQAGVPTPPTRQPVPVT
ncbi:MAG TPA: hypothetical protein VFJ85_00085 [Acidimicrobiales bacterium]|nr:hypothetical protein [Acidimicrobiales bacterium]